jgi:hypothetical protein
VELARCNTALAAGLDRLQTHGVSLAAPQCTVSNAIGELAGFAPSLAVVKAGIYAADGSGAVPQDPVVTLREEHEAALTALREKDSFVNDLKAGVVTVIEGARGIREDEVNGVYRWDGSELKNGHKVFVKESGKASVGTVCVYVFRLPCGSYRWFVGDVEDKDANKNSAHAFSVETFPTEESCPPHPRHPHAWNVHDGESFELQPLIVL